MVFRVCTASRQAKGVHTDALGRGRKRLSTAVGTSAQSPRMTVVGQIARRGHRPSGWSPVQPADRGNRRI